DCVEQCEDAARTGSFLLRRHKAVQLFTPGSNDGHAPRVVHRTTLIVLELRWFREPVRWLASLLEKARVDLVWPVQDDGEARRDIRDSRYLHHEESLRVDRNIVSY